MMGYKDKTWCSRWLDGDCSNRGCPYAFTSKDREDATKWWGNKDFPLMMGDRKTEDCGYEG